MTTTAYSASTPRPYPRELAVDVVSEKGLGLLLRPIRADDDVTLVEFHARLSADSVYRRYFSLHPVLSETEVRHLTHVDYVDRFAFIVLRHGVMIGVGRYDRIPRTSEAEVAFVIEDQYQGQGIGLLLLQHLADAATSLGLTHFRAETLASNRDMMNVFYHSGYEVATELECEVISVRFPITPTDVSRAVRERQARIVSEVLAGRDPL